MALAIGCIASFGLSAAGCQSLRAPDATSTLCVYPGPYHGALRIFERLIHAHVGCVEVFDDQAQTWAQWQDPWFVANSDPATNWVRFARGADHLLIITVSLFPRELEGTDWLAAGSKGAFVEHARLLARNLVAAGMARAIIRLAPEANGTWYPYSLRGGETQWRQWAVFWRLTAQAMRSVRGARFRFNWCIADGFRAIPFALYYPGDGIVSSIGVDIYDSRSQQGGGWRYQLQRPGGLAALQRFATAHHRPLSFPEWGLDPRRPAGEGADPSFMRQLAGFIGKHHVTFQAYFFRGESRTELLRSPAMVRLYRSLFSGG